jgi:hypothetical protein
MGGSGQLPVPDLSGGGGRPTPSTSAGHTASTGGSSGGTAATTAATSALTTTAKMKAEYIRFYKLILKIKPNMKLINRALKGSGMGGGGPLLLSEFEDYVRASDPRYMSSVEGKSRAAQFLTMYSQIMPGKPLSSKMLQYAVRNDLDTEGFYGLITSQASFKKANPTFAASGLDLPDYESYKFAQNQSYNNLLGRDATDDERRMLFSSQMTPSDFNTQMNQMAAGVTAQNWATNDRPTTGEFDQSVYGGTTLSNIVKTRLAQSAGQQQSYFNAPEAGFDMTKDAQTGNITDTY